MLRREKNGIEWLEFELLQDFPDLVHGVFLRHGGVSQGHFSSLNMGENTGDDGHHVQENRNRAYRALGVSQAVSLSQVHSDRVFHVTRESILWTREADALVTQLPGVALMIKHADCQAAIFYDPQHRALANVHAGWKGIVKNIYAHTLQKMAQVFGTWPQDLLVCISPSLGPLHSEFKNYREEFPESLWKFQERTNYFNLWEIARMQLQNCGVLPHHIEIASLCTYSHPESFFSYRRDKITGRNATLVGLKDLPLQ